MRRTDEHNHAGALRASLFVLAVMLLCGCISHQQQTATAVDPATTQPSYWLDQPATASVNSADFQKLWNACEDVARDYLFRLDRVDYRSGLLTTRPMVSAQWFEPWRVDVPTAYDRTESSMATIRRTIRFEFARQLDGTWQVTPKVLVERQTIAERRITSVVLYRNVFTQPRDPKERATGTHESDVGTALPQRYWYPLRRDVVFERSIAGAIQSRLRHT